ncbi:GNAT family N-acetyltransferase [Ktedonospora formicarum]|uniref:N-acetyltransferase domain-containing protein n=1 Tax=Ktedonospora formicarum TaxID=2778364 RepID=A0A8J3HXA9_9CHLR|nr:GNAT family N-acetyltransferase [Ktedonospora formicarum]GHO42367.1 hypothetical protein KSX_05300 [Ktedonospora formicarum]
MVSSPIVVRPLATQKEIEQQYIWADQAFSQAPDPENARQWSQVAITRPDFRALQLRGAFRDDTQRGGYILGESILRIGEARISTGCIGMVVADPEARKQGIASAMMHDAIQFAQEQGHSLLLLDGIPKFYYRFGYTDIFDVSTYAINRAAILARPASTHTVRRATSEDAQTIRDLYTRRLGHYTGGFERSTGVQEFLLRNRFSKNVVLLATSPTGVVEGYLISSREPDKTQVVEVAADTWAAQLALMQEHARLSTGGEEPATHTYHLPPTSTELYRAIDNLEVPDTSQWRHPAEEGGIRSSQYHHRFAGWMGRFVHLPTFFNALKPELQARWQRSLANWSGELHFVIGDESITLSIAGGELDISTNVSSETITFQCSPQNFIQLVFGYRPLSWVLAQHPQALPVAAQSALEILFPAGDPWISFSDWF